MKTSQSTVPGASFQCAKTASCAASVPKWRPTDSQAILLSDCTVKADVRLLIEGRVKDDPGFGMAVPVGTIERSGGIEDAMV